MAVGAVSLAATGCPGGEGPLLPDGAAGTTTTRPPNLPPVIEAAGFARGVGESLASEVAVGDRDGTVRRIAWSRRPPGFVAGIDGAAGGGRNGDVDTSFTWTPPVAGTWAARLSATDDDGATTTAEVVFEARHPQRTNMLVGLGDSVAGGFGLELTDALLGDPCWRAPKAAYPALALAELVDADVVPSRRARLVLAACAGASTVEVWDTPTWLPPGAPDDLDGAGWSQLDWAVRLNPGFVTLTVGANDVGVVDLSVAPDGRLDRDELQRRVVAVSGGVGYLLEQLVQRTDARIAVTTYHNPTALDPTGLGRCSGECFVGLTAEVHAALNTALRQAAAPYAPRVRLVDIAPLFAGHEAGDALGPSWLRKPIEALLGVKVGAYCSRGDPGGSWISSLDCIHPGDDGMQAIAEAVAAVLARPG